MSDQPPLPWRSLGSQLSDAQVRVASLCSQQERDPEGYAATKGPDHLTLARSAYHALLLEMGRMVDAEIPKVAQ